MTFTNYHGKQICKNYTKYGYKLVLIQISFLQYPILAELCLLIIGLVTMTNLVIMSLYYAWFFLEYIFMCTLNNSTWILHLLEQKLFLYAAFTSSCIGIHHHQICNYLGNFFLTLFYIACEAMPCSDGNETNIFTFSKLNNIFVRC